MPVAQDIQQLNKGFWCKVHYTKSDIVVAICDEELLGKEIEVQKDFKIKISENFYGDLKIGEKEAVYLMEKATIGNFFGERIVSLAEKNGFITKENIILIKGIPHAQFVKLI